LISRYSAKGRESSKEIAVRGSVIHNRLSQPAPLVLPLSQPKKIWRTLHLSRPKKETGRQVFGSIPPREIEALD
jgi:hypothetical protein